jgi:predicted SAM-dependent methyltransferase
MNLDIACGPHKQAPDWIGMDIQSLPGVDIVHDLNLRPWPFESDSIDLAHAWHIVEHIPPVSVTSVGTRFPFIAFMNECWRVLKIGAIIDIECPYGGSDGFYHDPTHCNPVTEVTWQYFAPQHHRYHIYSPKPWEIVSLRWTRDGNVNVKLMKLDDKNT